jgi:hypothetical protein
VRLAHLYPDDYKQLLVEERKSDEQQGKTWTGSIDDTRLTITTHTRANAVPALTTSAGDQSQDEGNNGGKA